ncbi:MAG: SDR family NAD(P)-dependent oxidoreductase [Aestuariivirga sp.]
MKRFEGKRAVVTGGLSGIGEAVAKRLEAEGGEVAIWDVGGGIKTDISDFSSVEKAMAATLKQLGGVDILVNSAGITGPTVPLAEFPIDGWLQTIAVNLNGAFFTNRAVVPHMVAQNYGRIVNIASIAGKEGNPNASAYSVAKAGLIALTKSLSKELAKTNIRVNCMTPAAVETEIFKQMTEAHIQFMLSKIPMSRFGKIEEVAAMICWLASEEMSFSTGAVFDISGGRATY